MLDSEIKTQFYYTLPADVKADCYEICVDIESLGQTTNYGCGCKFDRPLSPVQKAEALLGCVKDVTSIAMLTQQIVDSGVLADNDLLDLFEEGADDA